MSNIDFLVLEIDFLRRRSAAKDGGSHETE